MLRLLSLGGLFLGLTGATMLAWILAVRGEGLSDELVQGASVRDGSATNGRVLVGGGLHGGK